MKRIFSLVMILGLMLTLCSCGKQERILYNVNLDKYVELDEYKGINIDTSSKEYKEVYDSLVLDDVINNGLNHEEEATKGTVKNGDIANINYIGKKDGVAFEGGTADNYDLTIGSDSFIDGFEDGLIGVEIGDTVDLNLKFPKDYGNKELSGAEVVFTVKVNYVKAAKTPEEFYSELGYNSVEDYNSVTKSAAVKQTIFERIAKNSKIKEYPADDVKTVKQSVLNMIEFEMENGGTTLEDYLEQNGQTQEEFEKYIISQQVEPLMEMQMIWYAILDNEGMSITKEEVNKEAENTLAQYKQQGYTIDEELFKRAYGEYVFEYQIVLSKVMDFLYENAKIS